MNVDIFFLLISGIVNVVALSFSISAYRCINEVEDILKRKLNDTNK